MWRTREAPEEESSAGGASGSTSDAASEASSSISSETDSAVVSGTESSGKSAESGSSSADGGSSSTDGGSSSADSGMSSTDGGSSSTDGGSSSADSSWKSDHSGASSPYRDGRWRWILFDVNSEAISSDLADHDTLRYAMKANKMKMFGSLCKNPEFRKKFGERILEFGETIFSPESVNKKLDEYAEQMTAPMGVHYRRFFGTDSGLNFTEITDTEIRGFFKDRYSTVQEFLKKNFEDYSD